MIVHENAGLMMLVFLVWVESSVSLLNGQSSSNWGYAASVRSHHIVDAFSGIEAETGKQWVVVELELLNDIDPLLVFDYGIDETITILRLQDRVFLKSGSGNLYRLDPSLLGVDGHFGTNIRLPLSGSKVNGKLAFRVRNTDLDVLELRVHDENFAAIRVPVVGEVIEPRLPEGAEPQSNTAVSFAVGAHGPIELPGRTARDGMQFYGVDLWGRSDWTRDVPSYFLNEGADANATAANGFFFEYMQSHEMLSLVTGDGYAAPVIAEYQGNGVLPLAYLPGVWTRSRLHFEIPVSEASLELQALFATMGLSNNGAAVLEPLRFVLREGGDVPMQPASQLVVQDTKDDIRLTLSLALIPDPIAWGIDPTSQIALWVRFENTGAEAGMLNPMERFWFQVDGGQQLPETASQTHPFGPPERVFLERGIPRSVLFVFPRDAIESADTCILTYAGVGSLREFAVDLVTMTLTPLPSSNADRSAETQEPLAPPKATPGSGSEETRQSRPSKIAPNTGASPSPKVRVTPTEVERPSTPYHATASAQAMEAMASLRTHDFAELIPSDYETFESILGASIVEESEPNEKPDEQTVFSLNQTVSGVLEAKGVDHWGFEVPASLTDSTQRFDLMVAFSMKDESFKGAHVKLSDSEGKERVNVWVDDAYASALRNLQLEPGTYTVSLRNYRDQPDTPYRMQVRAVNDGLLREAQPNEWKQTQLRLRPGEVLHGLLAKGDRYDHVIWEVLPEQADLRHDILLVTEPVGLNVSVTVYDAERNKLYAKVGAGELVLGDFSPLPEILFLAIESRNEQPLRYQLKIQERGRWQQGWEREPNDSIDSPHLIVVDSFVEGEPELQGRLEGSEGDFFAVNVTDRDHLYHVSVAGPDQVKLSSWNKRQGKLASSALAREGEAASLVDLRLPHGLNYFLIEGSHGDYAVNVQQVEIPAETYEWEPNDSESQAQWMLPGVSYFGRLLSNDEWDFFRVVVRQAMEYVFTLRAPDNGKLRMQVSGIGSSGPGETIQYRARLLPGSYVIRLQSSTPAVGFYELRVDADPTPEGLERGEIDGLTVQSVTELLEAAAFEDDFQEVRQRIQLKNSRSTELELDLVAVSTSHQVSVGERFSSRVNLGPGETRFLEVPWVLEPDLPGSERIQVYLGCSDGSVITFAQAAIQPSTESLATGLLRGRQLLADSLAGGLNLNALDLGARPVLEPESLYLGTTIPSENHLKYLTDGVLAKRSFLGEVAVIQMAGDGKVDLVGTSIELHGRGNLWQSAKDFSIEVSTDGARFTEVFSGSLEPRTGEQAFRFAQPVKGRFARLRLHNVQSGKAGEKPHVGEWRMIADSKAVVPGWEEIDLLDDQLGGHRILASAREWVYGFQHNRAARLSALVWTHKPASSETYANARSVTLEVSETSPVGPWTWLGTFDLSPADQAEHLSQRIPLEGAPWARFVRLSWDQDAGDRKTNDPHKLSLIERPVGADYRSILGEWQGPTSFAYREYLEKQSGEAVPARLERIESSRESPYALAPNIWVDSVAWINRGWADWYEIEPVQVKKQLQFTVEARPFLKVAVEVFNRQGKAVKVSEKTVGAYRKEFTFLPEPGVSYRVHVFEPKRSIVYLWDVSGSMLGFRNSIENAVLKFAEEIDSTTEQVQLLPFDEPPSFLTDAWLSDRYELQNLIRNYVAPSSSNAHLNLLAATKALKEQVGTKAAIVITDCASPRRYNDQLWKALEEVKPAVFTFQTSDQTSGYRIEQDDMQDWASVAGGFYHNTRATHELDGAFEKVQAYLRRPAPYRIQLTAPELRPSTITVRDKRDSNTIRDPEKDGVLLIVDASASMRQNLPDGQMKVNAAKAVIEELIQQYLPDGVHFGLRVFGHRGGTDCESELMIPVAPLDRIAARQKLMFIRSSSLGNTSLGESLSKAGEDLKGLAGLKRVVVLTDGEETCRQDPAAEIAKLANAGLDVTVNIVGFTLGDESVKQNYGNWVKATGGKYYDAQDATALGKALQEAMTPVDLPGFEIYDAFGELVATGQVGDAAIEVDSGVYTVKILDPDSPRSETVEAFETHITVDFR